MTNATKPTRRGHNEGTLRHRPMTGPSGFTDEIRMERFIDDGIGLRILTPPQCSRCVHYDRAEPGKTRCSAFPRGIPIDILTGRIDHSKPYSGDGGIRFEPQREFSSEGGE